MINRDQRVVQLVAREGVLGELLEKMISQLRVIAR